MKKPLGIAIYKFSNRLPKIGKLFYLGRRYPKGEIYFPYKKENVCRRILQASPIAFSGPPIFHLRSVYEMYLGNGDTLSDVKPPFENTHWAYTE